MSERTRATDKSDKRSVHRTGGGAAEIDHLGTAPLHKWNTPLPSCMVYFSLLLLGQPLVMFFYQRRENPVGRVTNCHLFLFPFFEPKQTKKKTGAEIDISDSLIPQFLFFFFSICIANFQPNWNCGISESVQCSSI